MNLGRSKRENKELPTIITDMSGTILYMNTAVTNVLYYLKIGDNVSRIIDLDYVMKLTMFERCLDITLTNIPEFNKAVVRVSGQGATRTLEVNLYKTEQVGKEVLLNEKKLFATYTDIISRATQDRVNIKTFINQIIDSLKSDLRFEYRSFDVSGIDEREEMLINVAHLSTLVVGIIIFINEVEYRNPIAISVNKLGDGFMLNISAKANTFTHAKGLQEISELYPKMAMRLAYVTSLCDDCGIDYTLTVNPDEIITGFEITEVVDTTGKLRYSPFAQSVQSFAQYISSMFMYDGFIETEEEEQDTE